MAESGPVKEVADQLGRIFRHLLPGVLILAAARASHPRWFVGRLNLADGWQLALLAVIAVMVGNTWYIVHRYTVHQLLDLALYRIKEGKSPSGYTAWLSKHVHDGNLFPAYGQELRQHVLFRNAQVLYLFILAEVLLVFAWAPAPDTLFARHRLLFLVGGVAILPFACWQCHLSHSIDCYAVDKLGGKRSTGAA